MTTATLNINVNAGQANKTVQQLNEDVKLAGGSAASLRLELRKTIQELQSLEPGSQRFQQLSLRAGELRDQIADTNAVVGQLAGNLSERLVRGITGVVSIGVAGFQTLSSTVALFGGESEELQKTMVRLQALMNLSQAIETFAGLDQKLVEVRAAFQSLTVSTNAQTLAQEGENIATTQGTVATTALGVAMKALPIVALVAGLATLAYGIYSYVSASDEAQKAEEKRKKQLEANIKAQKEMVQSVAKESGEFTTLIYRLKQTNANSVERTKLIKEINAQYGTTLKNLSDENLFQEQLNGSVNEYINLQYNRFKLEKNREYIDAQNEKRLKAEQEYNKLLIQFNKNRLEAGTTLTRYNSELQTTEQYTLKAAQTLGDYRDRNGEFNKQLLEVEKTLRETEEATDKLGLRRNQLIAVDDKLTKGGKQYVEQTKESTKAVDDNSAALERQKALLENIKNVYDRNLEAEIQLIEARKKSADVMTSGMSLVEKDYDEYAQLTEKFTKTVLEYSINYYSERLDIQQDYVEKERSLIQKATQREIDVLDEKFTKGLIKEDEYIKQRDLLQKEGVKYLTDNEKKLLDQLKINNEIALSLFEENYVRRQEIATAQADLTAIQVQQITLQREKETLIKSAEQEYEFKRAEGLKSEEELLKLEKEKNDKILAIKSNYLTKETDLINLESEKQKQILLKQKEIELSNVELTSEEKRVIEEKYNKDIVDLNVSTQDKIQNAIEGTVKLQETQLQKLQTTLDKVSDYLGAFQNVYQMFEDTLTMYLEEQNQIRLTNLQDSYNKELALLDSNLAEGILSEEEYRTKLDQLNEQQQQKEKELKRKQFNENKQLNIVNATINGAQAVLSTFANTPGGVIIKGIAAALAAVFVATQIALISRQQFRAAGGGLVPGDGSGEIDSVNAMLAPGEAVINSKSTNAFLPLLSAINEMGGGKSLMPDLPAINQGQRFQPVFVNQNQPQLVRAYVVESDISASQKRVNRIERSTTF
jgi:uncharacterized membrane protein